jgi:sugar phosphate isomerase/epimerase
VSLAEPVLRKHQIKLAIENHKDWRFAEHIAWLKRLGSEWVGVCVDTGNNIALCEDSTELAEAYAPYAVFCHIKDMAVDEYEQGFLLDEVPMGEGLLDLPKIVGILRRANPNIIIDLEMITRDPLKIPVLTDKYWVTFDNSYSPLPGRDLARTLAMVRAKRSKTPLPQLSQLSLEEQVKAEDANNLKCIAYARRYLDL